MKHKFGICQGGLAAPAGLSHMKISWLIIGIIGAFRWELMAHLSPHLGILAADHPNIAADSSDFALNEGTEFHMR